MADERLALRRSNPISTGRGSAGGVYFIVREKRILSYKVPGIFLKAGIFIFYTPLFHNFSGGVFA